eukprot:236895-Amphidinium_carterae.1
MAILVKGGYLEEDTALGVSVQLSKCARKCSPRVNGSERRRRSAAISMIFYLQEGCNLRIIVSSEL